MLKPGQRFVSVFPGPMMGTTIEVERRLDDEHVAIRRPNGARQVFPISTLTEPRYWLPADAPSIEDGVS